MGVESQAILERWVAEPESRPFVTWDQLIVVTAQVGEEHKKDTIRDCEARMLPLLREHNVRFVEVARRGFHEEDGIVVLQDTRQPMKMHPDGCYSLSSYLLRSGTVPQFGGEHRCAMKFKAFVIETWLALEFQHLDLKVPVHHVFGYNADETTRTAKSEYHIARHNADRDIERPKTPLMVFGFNSEEIGRVERSMLYDGPNRVGNYPLDEWAWPRQKCIDYIQEKSGIVWRKSACSFCLAGDTLVSARGGISTLRELAKTGRQILTPRRFSAKSLSDFKLLERGEYQEAPVRSFGIQKLWHIRFQRGSSFKDVFATAEHRWILEWGKGERTTATLQPGDLLPHVRPPEPSYVGTPFADSYCSFEVCFVEPTDREEEVFCATVEGAGAFVLEGGLVTGNCPFCAEASKGEPDAVARWNESPEQTARGMLVEYNSLCFNYRGHLYRDKALRDVVQLKEANQAMVEFAKLLDEAPWSLYRVRRIYTAKGKAMRYVERLTPEQTRSFATASLLGVIERDAPDAVKETRRGIDYYIVHEREEDVYPTRQEFYVVAPGYMEDKLRGKPEKFNERWERVGQGLPMNPEKVTKPRKKAKL